MKDSYVVVPPADQPPGPGPSPSPQPVPVVIKPPAPWFQYITGASILVLTVVNGMLVYKVVPVTPPRPVPVVPAPVNPGPRPPSPVVPTPPSGGVIPATTKLHVSLVYDPAKDAQSLAAVTSDATLAGTLKALNAEWYVLSVDDARSIGLDTKYGATSPPLLAVQSDGDENHPRIYGAPHTSADVVSVVKQLRGKN